MQSRIAGSSNAAVRLDLAILERDYPSTDSMAAVFAFRLSERLQDQGNEFPPVITGLSHARYPGTNGCRRRAQRTRAASRIHHHCPQHHYQHAADVGCGLDASSSRA